MSHKESKISHSLRIEEEEVRIEEGDDEVMIRRSERNKSKEKKNYKEMNNGQKIMTEGTTEVSKHVMSHEHKEGDIIIKAVTYDEIWLKRGIREAIEIKKRKPDLNLDEGRYYLPRIYDNLWKEDNVVQKTDKERSAISNGHSSDDDVQIRH